MCLSFSSSSGWYHIIAAPWTITHWLIVGEELETGAEIKRPYHVASTHVRTGKKHGRDGQEHQDRRYCISGLIRVSCKLCDVISSITPQGHTPPINQVLETTAMEITYSHHCFPTVLLPKLSLDPKAIPQHKLPWDLSVEYVWGCSLNTRQCWSKKDLHFPRSPS